MPSVKDYLSVKFFRDVNHVGFLLELQDIRHDGVVLLHDSGFQLDHTDIDRLRGRSPDNHGSGLAVDLDGRAGIESRADDDDSAARQGCCHAAGIGGAGTRVRNGSR